MKLLHPGPAGKLRAVIQPGAALGMADDVSVVDRQYAFAETPNPALLQHASLPQARIEQLPVDLGQGAGYSLEREQVSAVARIACLENRILPAAADALQPLAVRVRAHR